MTSVLDLAKLSANVYKDGQKSNIGKWIFTARYGVVGGKGFYAELYTNDTKKDVVFVVRGTDFDKKDLSDFAADAQIFFGSVPHQIEKARKAIDSAVETATKMFGYGFKFWLTGHSLGVV